MRFNLIYGQIMHYNLIGCRFQLPCKLFILHYSADLEMRQQ